VEAVKEDGISGISVEERLDGVKVEQCLEERDVFRDGVDNLDL
jgi:hypothetical protein